MREATARSAAEIVDLALTSKPELMIHSGDLPASAEALRDLLAAGNRLFDRGTPVRIVMSTDSTVPGAIALSNNGVVMEAHRVCQPVKFGKSGEIVSVTLPSRLAQMYLDMIGDWRLRPLAGISVSPLLSSDGRIRVAEGFDPDTGLWCHGIPSVAVPSHPSRWEAELALRHLRQTFRTFPFADSIRRFDEERGVEMVDIAEPPGNDESAFLLGLLTACCRTSLWLAPGVLLTAPTISGAGSGKGLLVRAMCVIAFGMRPRAFTMGHGRDELDKRLAAELIDARPAVFLDNANGVALKSDTLASVLTERPAGVRLLGETRMVPLNSTTFIAITGNGVNLSEDLARRFVVCELDARCEDPESRPFSPGFLNEIEANRSELLAAALTIWRWGRQNADTNRKGKPLGSFEEWAQWCRDPLLELGCRDPVERIEKLKARDPKRQQVVEVFTVWWEKHGDNAVAVKDLDESVKAIIDPQSRGRQYVASTVASMVGTHAGGFVLTAQSGPGRWSRTTYLLRQSTTREVENHRGHRDHRGATAPMPPMVPMPAVSDEALQPGQEAAI